MSGNNSTTLPGDNPILEPHYDLFRRSDLAGKFVQGVLELDATRGAAVGVFAPWGAGKTSFVNLARKTFKQESVQVLDFNPWLFSGTEQLVDQFFAELSAEMGGLEKSEKLGEAFKKYGQALSAVTSAASMLLAMPQIAAISKALTTTADAALQEESINTLRQNIETELKRRNTPLIVVLDDVDRLSTQEIRDVFRLVRLTASFPNLIYIVVCDRHRIEQALDDPEQRMSGRDYLEKIIQWPFNLPEVPQHLLEEQLMKAVEHAIADIENLDQLDGKLWENIREEIIRPLIRNMRDVRRYALAIRPTLGGLDRQVALVDVLALEAVRLFLPDIFRLLHGAIDGLTGASRMRKKSIMQAGAAVDPDYVFKKTLEGRTNQVTELVSTAEKDRDSETARTVGEVVNSLLFNLFPAGAQLSNSEMDPLEAIEQAHYEAEKTLGKRRVAHEQVFRLYLEQVESPDLLAFYDAERALALMSDSEELDEFIRSLDQNRWLDVISCLSNFLDLRDRKQATHDRKQAEGVIIVLLNLWPDIPERSLNSGIQIHDSGWNIIGSVIGNMLRALEMGTISTELAMHNIWPKVTSLSSKLGLVHRIGYQMGTGNKLVEPEVADEFEKKLLEEIHAATADGLAKEHRILQVLAFAKKFHRSPYDVPDSPELTLVLLRSVRGETTTRSADSNGVQRRPTLDWERLTHLIGSEDMLKVRINNLKAYLEDPTSQIEVCGVSRDEARDLLSLVDRYLGGEQTDES